MLFTISVMQMSISRTSIKAVGTGNRQGSDWFIPGPLSVKQRLRQLTLWPFRPGRPGAPGKPRAPCGKGTKKHCVH